MSELVAAPGIVYTRMADAWALPKTLMGGTRAIRAAGETYLPRDPNESHTAWQNRRDRSTLFNGYRRAVWNLKGKVFAKDLQLEDDVPGRIRDELAENIDNTGRSVHEFAKDVFEDGLVAGISYILVDFPINLPGRTLAEERAQGLRTYWCPVKSDQVIGFRSSIVNGEPVLVQVRIMETNVEQGAEEFSESEKTRIRVYDRIFPAKGKPGGVMWRIFEQTDDNDWVEMLRGMLTIDEIPLVPFYGERVGFFEGRPPLEDLAWENLAHWQSGSDQRHILHVARVPILFGTGLQNDEANPIVIGPNRLVEGGLGSTLEYVEHEGKALSAGRDDLKDIEERMQLMAIEPLLPRSGTPTATGRALDSAEAMAPLQMMANGIANTLEKALRLTAKWEGLGDDGGSVKVNKDFGLSLRDAADVDALIKARLAGQISRETLWIELRRRRVLSDDFDPEQEALQIEEEGPPMGGDDEEEDEGGQPSSDE